MTVLLGPTPCIRCGEPVTVVRRRFHFDCGAHGRICHSASLSISFVDGAGNDHSCLPSEHMFGTMAGPEQAAESHILNVALVSQLAPEVRAPFHVGSKTT